MSGMRRGDSPIASCGQVSASAATVHRRADRHAAVVLIERPTVLVSALAAGYLLVAARQVRLRERAVSLPVAARRDLVAVLDALEHAAHAYRVPIADVRDDADPDDAAEASSTCTVGDAATLLRLSARRVQEFAAAGILPGRRIGRSWLLDRAAVEHLAATRREAA